MAKKATKKKAAPARPQLGDNVEILSAGEVIERKRMILLKKITEAMDI